MTVAADLFALQETDLALDTALARLAEVDEQLGESEELLSARSWLEAATENVRRLKSTQSDLEFEADEVRAKVGQVEAKLYGGEVTDSRELSDLDADLKSLKNNLQTREDSLLASIELTEEGEAVSAQAQSILSGVEARWQADQSHLLAEKADLEPEIERLRAIREEQSGGADRAGQRRGANSDRRGRPPGRDGRAQASSWRRTGYHISRTQHGTSGGRRLESPRT